MIIGMGGACRRKKKKEEEYTNIRGDSLSIRSDQDGKTQVTL